MKTALFLLLALGAASTSACDPYASCFCSDSDGLHNDTATTSVCTKLSGTMLLNPDPLNNWLQCASTTGTGWDNCCFRELCQSLGAEGDSQCGASPRNSVPCPN
jgi:hypothetical protein